MVARHKAYQNVSTVSLFMVTYYNWSNWITIEQTLILKECTVTTAGRVFALHQSLFSHTLKKRWRSGLEKDNITFVRLSPCLGDCVAGITLKSVFDKNVESQVRNSKIFIASLTCCRYLTWTLNNNIMKQKYCSANYMICNSHHRTCFIYMYLLVLYLIIKVAGYPAYNVFLRRRRAP